jgi:hypothetical protein
MEYNLFSIIVCLTQYWCGLTARVFLEVSEVTRACWECDFNQQETNLVYHTDTPTHPLRSLVMHVLSRYQARNTPSVLSYPVRNREGLIPSVSYVFELLYD